MNSGEDSKTLMLVHVSPREEDLCETICSLNFAARVKSVHLGHEESKVSCLVLFTHLISQLKGTSIKFDDVQLTC